MNNGKIEKVLSYKAHEAVINISTNLILLSVLYLRNII